MTEWLLALVPTYGAWLLAGVTFLSALALPVPCSIENKKKKYNNKAKRAIKPGK